MAEQKNQVVNKGTGFLDGDGKHGGKETTSYVKFFLVYG
jgi:hypothetical protein